MANTFLNLSSLSNENLLPTWPVVISSMGPLSEYFNSNRANVKRTLVAAKSEEESSLPTKKLQLTETEFSKKTENQLKKSTRSRDSKKDCPSTTNNRRDRAHKRDAAKQEDIDLINDMYSFFNALSSQTQTTSEGTSLIRANLFKTSLANQTSEESKVEKVALASSQDFKTPTKSKMPRAQSKNNLNDTEDSTAMSDREEISEEEISVVETPNKSSALPEVETAPVDLAPLRQRNPAEKELATAESPATSTTASESGEQKIVNCPIGEMYQVSEDFFKKLGSLAPRKTKPKLMWAPEEEKLVKLSECVAKLEKSLRIEKITNEEKIINIAIDNNFDFDKTYAFVTQKSEKSRYQTMLNPEYKARYGLRGSK